MQEILKNITMGYKKFIIKNPDELSDVAREIIFYLNHYPVVSLSGTLGSGKTALVKEICKLLKVKDIVTSPTFTLVNEYSTPEGIPIYHFDFYRISRPEEIYDLGYEEYLFSGKICFIEWPEMAENMLLPDTLRVNIVLDNTKHRHITIELPEKA